MLLLALALDARENWGCRPFLLIWILLLTPVQSGNYKVSSMGSSRFFALGAFRSPVLTNARQPVVTADTSSANSARAFPNAAARHVAAHGSHEADRTRAESN